MWIVNFQIPSHRQETLIKLSSYTQNETMKVGGGLVEKRRVSMGEGENDRGEKQYAHGGGESEKWLEFIVSMYKALDKKLIIEIFI